ncbi:MAG: hypothetical protein DDT21_00540 [Syntrophomonadaceae bacterium]|nr:hypothetical protein [Bacillota bacterium]
MQKYLDKRLSRNEALVFLALAALLWSLGGLLIKLVDWHPLAIAGARSAIAALLFGAVLRRPKLDWSPLLCGGALAYAATVILFVSATRLTTAANAILLQFTAPVYVALLASWLLKERTRPVDWAAIFFVMVGMGLFFVDGFTAGNQLGNALAVCSGISFAAMLILLRLQKNGATLEPLFLGNVLTALIGAPFMTAPFPGFTGWGALIVLGLFQLGLSYLLYAVAVRHVTALEASLVPVIEPLLNPVWVFLALGEAPGGWALAGGALVLSSVTGRIILVSGRIPARGSENTTSV